MTGCRRGIGRAGALALAAAGADIVGASASLEADGGEIGREVEASGRAFAGYRCDFADRAAVYALIEELQRDLPRIDILLNNAGTIARMPAAEHPDGLWDRVLEVNLTAQFVLTREIGKRMLADGGGKIVFIASLLSFQGGITCRATPPASRDCGPTRALANEWAARGVNVNAIAPGYVRTDNTEALQDDPVRHPDSRADPGGPLGRARRSRRSNRLSFIVCLRLRQRHRAAGRRRLARTVTLVSSGLSAEHDVVRRLDAVRVLSVLSVAER